MQKAKECHKMTRPRSKQLSSRKCWLPTAEATFRRRPRPRSGDAHITDSAPAYRSLIRLGPSPRSTTPQDHTSQRPDPLKTPETQRPRDRARPRPHHAGGLTHYGDPHRGSRRRRLRSRATRAPGRGFPGQWEPLQAVDFLHQLRRRRRAAKSPPPTLTECIPDQLKHARGRVHLTDCCGGQSERSTALPLAGPAPSALPPGRKRRAVTVPEFLRAQGLTEGPRPARVGGVEVVGGVSLGRGRGRGRAGPTPSRRGQSRV